MTLELSADEEALVNSASAAGLAAILRNDFSAFVEKVFGTVCPGDTYRHNWHIDHLVWCLEEARARRRRRQIINLPPRSLKSICISVAFPAWLLGQDPSARIIVISYSDDLARTFARHTRTVMLSEWYRRAFPGTRLSPDKRSEVELVTTQQGFRYATSIGGTLTGRGADYIIVDDPLKAGDATSAAQREGVNQWYDETLVSRLDDKARGVILLVAQRLHEGDLTGHLLAKGGFDHIRIKAIATEDEDWSVGGGHVHTRRAGEPLHGEREGLDVLATVKRDTGSLIFEAQYQQDPVPAGGSVFKREWLKYYQPAEKPRAFTQIVQSWDTATKIGETHDWSVCTTWGITETGYYLLDVLRGRWKFPELRRLVVDHVRAHAANLVLIEDAGSGQSLIQSLQSETRLNVVGDKPKLDKETRAIQQSAPIEAGRVWFPADAPWLAELQHELLGFPNARHDDQVDSLVQFLRWAAEDDAKPKPPVVAPWSFSVRPYFRDY